MDREKLINAIKEYSKVNTMNFKILHDAGWLVNLPDEYNVSDQQKKRGQLRSYF